MKITSFFPRAQSKEPKEPKDREIWSPAAAFRGVMATLTGPRVSPAQPADDPETEAESDSGLETDQAQSDGKDDSHVEPVSRPSKRQKVAASTASPRPPLTLTHKSPGDSLLMTTNGVASEVVSSKDDSSVGPSPDIAHLPTKSPTSDKRSLRSRDEGTKLKSELATYFPNYEDMINDVDTHTGKSDTITADAILLIKRSASDTKPSSSNNPKLSISQSNDRLIHPTATPSTPQYNGALELDFTALETSVEHLTDDPLNDDVYLRHHKRAEGREKRLRNIEKERAMHEKVQLERLLAGLQGHDWLRVLGITGVTDSEARKYEIKRDYFIDEVQALVQKFVRWKDEEKRLKALRESAYGAVVGGGVCDEDAEVEEEQNEQQVDEEVDERPRRKLGRPRKDHQVTSPSRPSTKTTRHKAALQPIPPPDLPFTSFFAKRHVRDAALAKLRPNSRTTIAAFGLPVPDLPEKDFALPPDMITPEMLKENARRRRRAKRESLIDSMSHQSHG